MSDIAIRACGDYYAPVGDAPPDLRALTKEATGKPVRRIGRFIQLALIGATRCAGAEKPPPETGVYLASRRADLEMIVEVKEHLFRDGFAPKPLSFINTVSNAACFYVAQHFGLHGRSSFVGAGCFAFETAAQIALLDLEMGAVRSALVGAIEIVAAPVDVHRKRLRLAPGSAVGEASHWIWLEAGGKGAGKLSAVEFLPDRTRLLAWIATQDLDPGRTLFAAGQFIPAADAERLQSETGIAHMLDYRSNRAYYDAQSGAALSAFFADASDARALLHVNGDTDGRYAVMLARR